MSSSNTSTLTAIDSIKWNLVVFARFYSGLLFALGLVGHTLNIYVFTRRTLRQNPCARYFLASTIAGCFVVLCTIPLRVLQLGYNIDVFVYSLTMCKMLSYPLGFIRVLPSWFIALASADRFLCSSSSPTLRAWSNVRVSSRAILITSLLVCASLVHMPIFYVIQLPQRQCSSQPGIYQAFFGIWNLIIWSGLPTGCMLVFGFLTIQHVRQGKKRVAPQNTQNHSQAVQKKTNRQLIQMMLLQAFVFGSTTSAYSFVNLYVSTRSSPTEDSLQKAQDSFLVNVFGYIALTGSCVSFYLFTLSSQLFRRELMNLFPHRQQPQTENFNLATVDHRETN